jgi:hypothetical protein
MFLKQAHLYARGNSSSAEWPAGSEELQAATWRRNTHSLPALRENSVVADSGSSGASSGRPSTDYNQPGSIHPAKVRHKRLGRAHHVIGISLTHVQEATHKTSSVRIQTSSG